VKAPPDQRALLELLEAYSMKDARRAVAALERDGYEWTPLGGTEGNFGLVNIGSDPGFAFVERITNALDAVIDEAARHAPAALVAELDSPRAAVAALFDIPEGRVVHCSAEAQTKLAGAVTVRISDGSSVARPLLDVSDRGTGIAPDAMPATILNLAGSNKIAKPYLAGAYGQGGSTTFAFSPDGTVIASATADSEVGVTFVRFRELDARTNKNGRYEYLVRPGARGVGRLTRAAVAFERGTLVRHFDYDLERYRGDARLPEQSILALVRTALFDPVLPFTIVEARTRFRRDPQAPPAVVYAGRFADLQRAGAALEYAQSVAIPLEPRGADNIAAAHYWVLAEPSALLHPDPRQPVVMTNFGQTHGTEERRVIVDLLRLPYLKNELVIQIELDGLSATVRRELLSTTRDRLKRGARYTALIDAIVDALGDDPQLQAANTRRRLQLLERQQKSDYTKLRRRFAELIEKFAPGDEAAAKRGAGNGAVTAAGGASESGPDAAGNPLPTLAHPTFLRIARGDEPLALRRSRRSIVRVESDAPDGYLSLHENARLVVVDPTLTSIAFVRASDFRGGRARLTVRTALPAGSCGELAVRLADAEGRVFADTAPYAVVDPPAPEPAADDGKSRLRVPNIYEVYSADWLRHEFTDASVGRAYESTDDYSIAVNMDNRHVRRLLTTIDYQAAGITRVRSSYLVQTAFYLFLQHEGRRHDPAIDDAALEAYQQRELDRVAQTIVSSIAAVERIDSAALLEIDA
jgi:hypothetical protein